MVQPASAQPHHLGAREQRGGRQARGEREDGHPGQDATRGRPVLFNSAPCGRCYNCLMGLRCTNSIHYGNSHVDPASGTMLRGGFGQYLLRDPNPAIFCVPDDMSTERALMSAIGNHTAMSGLRKINAPGPGDTVVVQGSGPVGMGALVQSRARGAARDIMFGAPSHRLALARELGADETIDLADRPTPESRIERVRELTGGGPDLVVEATGARTSVHEGLQMARYGGKYLVIGLILPTSVEMDPSRTATKDLTVAGVVGSKVENIIHSMRLMGSRIEVPVEKMITHQCPLAQVNQALQSHLDPWAMVPVVNHSLG